MLIVKIELHSARTGEVKEIGRMEICNTSGRGRGRYDRRADYVAYVLRRGKRGNVYRSGRVKDFPRLSYNVWRLVLRCLRECFPEEK